LWHGGLYGGAGVGSCDWARNVELSEDAEVVAGIAVEKPLQRSINYRTNLITRERAVKLGPLHP